MTFHDWLKNTSELVERHGAVTGGRIAAQEFGVGVGRRVGQRVNYGTPYWEKGDWDVLVLVDACRHDLMQESAPDYDFVPQEVPATYSPASMSREWLERHIQPEYRGNIEETALVSANAFTRHDWVRDAGWQHLDEVWTHGWSETEGTVLPSEVTDAAISCWRDGDADQMIVWYLQPHAPFLNAEWSRGFDKREIGDGAGTHKSVWRRLRDGELTHDEVWRAYRENLNLALEEVAVLLENLDADNVVLSSDHANCLGEWGVYGHPHYVPVPELKKVPWIETTARDQQTRLPEQSPDRGDQTVTDAAVEKRLADLGYV